MRRVSRTALVITALSALALTACADPSADSGTAGAGADDGSGQTAIRETGPDDPTSDDGDDHGTDTGTESTTPPAGAALPAQLSVTVDDGNGNVTTYALSCEPVGGDHPDPAAACAGLAAAGTDVFAPTNPDLACTEIYGGPQTATVTGRVGGTQVTSTFSRENGCEIARWDAIAPVLGNSGGAY
ncbi:MAG: SSI family serine proteinase inhibitor [Geodermatophilaceae bacterium]